MGHVGAILFLVHLKDAHGDGGGGHGEVLHWHGLDDTAIFFKLNVSIVLRGR